MQRFAIATVFVLAACGSKTKTGTVEHTDPMHHENGAHSGEGMHPTMPAAVDAFHAKLAPLWHAEAGAQRTADTCAAVGDMDAMLVDAENAGAPEGVAADAWSEKLSDLRTKWGLLAADCGENKAANFTAVFTEAHTAFHALIELLPMADK